MLKSENTWTCIHLSVCLPYLFINVFVIVIIIHNNKLVLAAINAELYFENLAFHCVCIVSNFTVRWVENDRIQKSSWEKKSFEEIKKFCLLFYFIFLGWRGSDAREEKRSCRSSYIRDQTSGRLLITCDIIMQPTGGDV